MEIQAVGVSGRSRDARPFSSGLLPANRVSLTAPCSWGPPDVRSQKPVGNQEPECAPVAAKGEDPTHCSSDTRSAGSRASITLRGRPDSRHMCVFTLSQKETTEG